MRREGRAALLALLLALTAGTASASGCTLVFGQGRNPPQAGGPDWDDLNTRFNAGAARALETQGRLIYALTASAAQIDPEAAGVALLRRADELGCATLVETALFAQDDILILRLRVYPMLPQIGAGGAIVGLRIGEALFLTQRELQLRNLQRLKPELLAAQMAAEYLERDQAR
jgi:hypothetical protein